MPKIAITGNIASGKSTVSQILLDHGFPVFDADAAAHDLINLPSVAEAFSNYDIFDATGKISRSKLGNLVFTNASLRKQLEAIIHPLVFAKMDEFCQQYSATDLLFAEIPLLFETGAEKQFDAVIFVYAADSIRLKRLTQRNKLSRADARARMSAQMKQDDKAAKSAHVIYNETSRAELSRQIFEILKIYQPKGK